MLQPLLTLMIALCQATAASRHTASEEHDSNSMGFLMFVVAVLVLGFILGAKFGGIFTMHTDTGDNHWQHMPMNFPQCKACSADHAAACPRRVLCEQNCGRRSNASYRSCCQACPLRHTQQCNQRQAAFALAVTPLAVYIDPARGETYHVSGHCQQLQPVVRVVRSTPCATCSGR